MLTRRASAACTESSDAGKRLSSSAKKKSAASTATGKTKTPAAKPKPKEEKLYCLCHRPDDHDFMIQCDRCKDWFHGGCVNVTKEIGEQLDEYMCPVCEEQTKDQVLRRSGRNARITLETLRLRELSLPPAQVPPVEQNESASVEPGEGTTQSERAGHSLTDSPPWEVAGAKQYGEAEVLEPDPTTSAGIVNTDEPTQSKSSERERLVKPIDKLCLFPGCGKPARPADNYCSDICTIADADNLLARVTARRVDAERSLEGSVKRPGGPPPLDAAELAAAAAGSEDVSPSEPASATDAEPPSEADGTSEPKLDSAEETEVKEMESKEEASSEVEEDTAAVSSNSLRLAVRRELGKIFETVLKVSEEKGTLCDEITRGLPIDQLSVKWAGSCERAMLKHWAERMSTASSASGKEATGERYKARFRTIRFNLRDPKNDRLRTRLVTGCILPRDLAILTADDMASDALLEEAEELRKQSIERRLIVSDATPELMSGKMVKMTHKGWVEIEREENVGSGFPPSLSPTVAESPSLSIQKPSSPFAASAPSSPLTLKRKESAASVAGSETSAAATSAADLASPTRKRPRVDVSPASQVGGEISILPTSTDSPRKQPSSTTTTPTYQKPNVHDMFPDLQAPQKPPGEQGVAVKKDDINGGDDANTNDRGVAETSIIPQSSTLRELPLAEYPPIWTGCVSFEELAKWTGTAVHILGRSAPEDWSPAVTSPLPWSRIMSFASVSVAGRIPPDRVTDYLTQMRWSPSKELAVVLFRPSADASEAYEAFWDYFNARDRYGVVKVPSNAYIKDFYIIPHRAGEVLADYLREIPGRVPSAISQKSLLGVFLLNKVPPNQPSSAGSSKKPSLAMSTGLNGAEPTGSTHPMFGPTPAASVDAILASLPGFATSPSGASIDTQTSASDVPATSAAVTSVQSSAELNPIVSQLLINLSKSMPQLATPTADTAPAQHPQQTPTSLPAGPPSVGSGIPPMPPAARQVSYLPAIPGPVGSGAFDTSLISLTQYSQPQSQPAQPRPQTPLTRIGTPHTNEYQYQHGRPDGPPLAFRSPTSDGSGLMAGSAPGLSPAALAVVAMAAARARSGIGSAEDRSRAPSRGAEFFPQPLEPRARGQQQGPPQERFLVPEPAPPPRHHLDSYRDHKGYSLRPSPPSRHHHDQPRPLWETQVLQHGELRDGAERPPWEAATPLRMPPGARVRALNHGWRGPPSPLPPQHQSQPQDPRQHRQSFSRGRGRDRDRAGSPLGAGRGGDKWKA